MGCHTWFYNKFEDIEENELETLKEKTKECLIKNSLYEADEYSKWVELVNSWLDGLDDEELIMIYLEMRKKDYYDTNRKRLLNDIKKLSNSDTSKDSAIEIIKRNGYVLCYYDAYCLNLFGWYDNYKITKDKSDGRTFDSANKALAFLEKNQDIIEGGELTKEIRETIIRFFNTYKNGFIEYV